MKDKPKLSNKLQRVKSEYDKKRVLFINEERLKDKKGRLFCIFCGGEIEGDPSLHHGLGRDDDVMLDERFWFLSHNFCHVHQYHSMSWSKIPWWSGYIERLKALEPSVSAIMLKMEEKRMEK
jgi:hypothetical protein